MSDITSMPTVKKPSRSPEERAARFQKSLKHLDKRMATKGAGTVTSTSVLDRSRLFAPTSEPEFRDTWTAPDAVPGVCTTQVRGRLGQSHAAMLESCLLRHTEEAEAPDGGLTITVPLAEVLRDMSTRRDYSWTSAMRLLRDLCEARVRLTDFGKTWGAFYKGEAAPDAVEGSFLLGWERQTVPGTARGRAGDKVQLLITLAPAYLGLIRHDRAPTARRERLACMHLRDGRSRAVARWLLSQDPKRQPAGGWRMDTVLEAVGAGGEPVQLKKARLALRTEAPEIWARCGIDVFKEPPRRKTPNRVRLLKSPSQA